MVSILRNLSRLYTKNRTYIYKIEEINENSNRIIISSRGRVNLVTTIDELGRNNYIINFLPPHHACWIGYYFGRKWSPQDKFRNINYENLCPTQGHSDYKIICQNRIGEIQYQNIKNGIIYTVNPLDLAQSKVISKFNSSQAFYVGFLAAIRNIKIENRNRRQTTTSPYLKLVK